MTTNQSVEPTLTEFLNTWTGDDCNAKSFFQQFHQQLAAKQQVTLDWVSRPGISHSLRGNIAGQTEYPLFVMIDVIDDDPDSRWLSVCFYGEMIDDPDDQGDLVPGGLLGKDGHCFDLDDNDPELAAYIAARIDQAYQHLRQRT